MGQNEGQGWEGGLGTHLHAVAYLPGAQALRLSLQGRAEPVLVPVAQVPALAALSPAALAKVERFSGALIGWAAEDLFLDVPSLLTGLRSA